MDLLSNLYLGLSVAFSPENLAYCFAGVFLGTFIGVLPGIGALAAVSLLLPITFHLDPTSALIMLAGIYYGAEYGGSIASILLRLPGTPSSAVTSLDGYPMAQQGKAGPAIFITTIASFFGANLGIIVLILFTPLLMSVALAFGPAEYFALMCLGLIAAATVSQGAPIKGLAMVALGLLLGCIGTDVHSGIARFNFGFYGLYDGINIIVVAMGLFGVSEVIASMNRPLANQFTGNVRLRDMLPTRQDMKTACMPMARGGLLGSFVGVLPATGVSVASFLSYALEKRVSKNPEKFGKGAVEGISSPEAANNAAAQTAFVPTLSLGIPGSATMAIMMGALLIHGISPGPRLMTLNPDLFWGLIASFWIGNVLLVILNIPLIGFWVKILKLPSHILYPSVICLICIGVYSINFSIFDIMLVGVLGLVGYAMKELDFEPAPLLIAFVLGPLLEENLRRALLIARGDFFALFSRPISAVLLSITIVLVLWAIWSSVMRVRKRRAPSPLDNL